MKNFNSYFIEKDIIFYLCRIRAKQAMNLSKKHNIHLLTNNPKYNYHIHKKGEATSETNEFQADLNKILPPRRKWKEIGEKSRYRLNKYGQKQKISTIDKNIFSLINTINYYKHKNPDIRFIKNLNDFIQNIKKDVIDPAFRISSPTIYPKIKEKKRRDQLKVDENNTCRPISLFTLKERLILSFTNKFLTNLFDKYFENSSLAFRATKIVNGHKIITTHHDAVNKILAYKSQYKNEPIWVAECDMRKFYDSVNHNIIIEQFRNLLIATHRDNPQLDTSNAENIFYNYLNCYCFNKNVLKFNNESEHWKNFGVEKGEYGWIQRELDEYKYYDNIESERIGIPQGGALSGLIANIVLDSVDKKMKDVPGLFYIRFCDDMILMHHEKAICEEALKIYNDTLEELKLVPHNSTQRLRTTRQIDKDKKRKIPEISLEPFWQGKSKGPYKWDEVNNDGYPWIGFVGYEMHYEGFVRIRKSSFKKELKKQREIINNILDAVGKNKRASNGTIKESAMRRLIGMSVGKVDLWNYDRIENEMCWKSGFRELRLNKYSIKQLKQLDKTRCKLYNILIKGLGESNPQQNNSPKRKKRKVYKYNRPFSYYYHVAK